MASDTECYSITIIYSGISLTSTDSALSPFFFFFFKKKKKSFTHLQAIS